MSEEKKAYIEGILHVQFKDDMNTQDITDYLDQLPDNFRKIKKDEYKYEPSIKDDQGNAHPSFDKFYTLGFNKGIEKDLAEHLIRDDKIDDVALDPDMSAYEGGCGSCSGCQSAQEPEYVKGSAIVVFNQDTHAKDIGDMLNELPDKFDKLEKENLAYQSISDIAYVLEFNEGIEKDLIKHLESYKIVKFAGLNYFGDDCGGCGGGCDI